MDAALEYRIRDASNADGPAVVGLVFGVLREFGLDPHPSGTDADLADIEASYLATGGAFEVIEAPDGAIVGSVAIYPLDRSAGLCELRKMYLHRDWRGRGLGKLMLQRALRRAKQLGFRRVEIETASVLKDAIALYERVGFRKTSHRPRAPRADQAYILDL